MTFHQRNSFPEAEVERGKQKSLSQAERILAHFQAHRHERLTPFDIHRCLFDATTPPTSIRRAMTDLTNEGLLIKHEDDQVQEIYGVSNCRWSLAPISPQTELPLKTSKTSSPQNKRRREKR